MVAERVEAARQARRAPARWDHPSAAVWDHFVGVSMSAAMAERIRVLMRSSRAPSRSGAGP
jgi:hypothetical protein